MADREIIREELAEAAQLVNAVLSDARLLEKIEQAAGLISDSIVKGGKVISCGNGGSMCDAMHFAEELSGRFRDDRRALPAIAISDPSHISCTANDYGFEYIFSRFVEGLGMESDVLLAISTSGNSQNVLRAARTARNLNMKVVSLTGNSGGELSDLSDIEIRVPHQGYADRIQEVHIKVIHILILLIERRLSA